MTASDGNEYQILTGGKRDPNKKKTHTVAFNGTTDSECEKVIIPSAIRIGKTEYKVTSIAPKAFAGNKKMKTVKIGKNVKKIGKKAFANCLNLRKIIVKSTKLKKVAKSAFQGDQKITTVRLKKKHYKRTKKLLMPALKSSGCLNTFHFVSGMV